MFTEHVTCNLDSISAFFIYVKLLFFLLCFLRVSSVIVEIGL